jgi:nitrate reductase gamma subunit
MTSFPIRKLLLVLAALGIAGGLTVLPWFLLFYVIPDSLSNFWGMTAILWAPLALVVGVAAGSLFAFMFWPRNTDH